MFIYVYFLWGAKCSKPNLAALVPLLLPWLAFCENEVSERSKCFKRSAADGEVCAAAAQSITAEPVPWRHLSGKPVSRLC